MVGMADGYRAGQRQARPSSTCTPRPGSATRWARSSTPRPTTRRCVITAGQQVRALITLQANLTNRDATRMPHPLVKWSYEPPRAEDVPLALARGDPPRHAAAARARSSSRSRWTTGTPRSTTPTSRAGDRAPGRRPRRRRPRGGRDARRAARRRRATRCWSPAPTSTPAAPGTPRSRSPSASACRSGRRPATGGGRLGFPEGHPNFRGVLPPAIGPVARDARGPRPDPRRRHLGLPLLPQHPRPAAARGRRAGRDHQRPRRGRAGADGRRDRRRRGAHAGGAARRGRRVRPRPGEPLPEPTAGPEEDPDHRDPLDASHALALAEVFPEDGIVVLESPVQHPRAAQPAAALAARQLLLRRRRRPRLRPRGRGRRPARPARPAGRLRARRGLGPVRDHRLLERRRLRRAGHLPRPAQQRVRDPQVVRRASSRSRARPASTCRRSTSPASPPATASARAGSSGRDELREALARRRSPPTEPELVEVRVAPGMSLF